MPFVFVLAMSSSPGTVFEHVPVPALKQTMRRHTQTPSGGVRCEGKENMKFE